MKVAVAERRERWRTAPPIDASSDEPWAPHDPGERERGGASDGRLEPPADAASSLALPASGSAGRPPASDVQDAAGGPASSVQPPASGAPARERLTEAQLTALWRGRRFPDGALVTRMGVPVTVVYQGRAGRGPGPDFRGAVICGPSGLTLRGDVELHVRSSWFHAHGHATDPAYSNVVLHVVFEDDTGEDTPLPGGRAAPVVALAPWVAQRAGELQRWLERPLLWREPCHDAATRMGAEGVGEALDAEGDRRFETHVQRFGEIVARDGLEQALYEGLLGALGYGGNTPAMLALARLLPWRALEDAMRGRAGRTVDGRRWNKDAVMEGGGRRSGGGRPKREAGVGRPELAVERRPTALSADAGGDERRLRFEALLLGAAGLLPSQRGHDGPVEAYVGELERVFASSGLAAMPSSAWKLWGVRPANAPARRIAAAAALLDALGAPSGLLRTLDASTVNEAIAPLSARASGYWLAHFDPCSGACTLPPGYVGRGRALEILLNVVLPSAAASGDPALVERARSLYAKLPRPAAYGVTRFLENALGSEGVRVPLNARRAQGLLALHRDWCTQGGCGRCPLS